ncbi:MAG: MBL fold metallo-hydrolase [Bacteroidetes bacterium]|nr:MBL fold metallo-hydrolase [Bacteroidota bacterium]
MLFPVFGKVPTGKRLERIQKSRHYDGKEFKNLSPTTVSVKGVSFFKVLWEFMHKPKSAVPSKPVPVVKTDLGGLEDGSIVWFGHSSYLLKLGGKVVLVDPVFSGNASPFKWFAKEFAGTEAYGVGQLPSWIDVVVLSHDHYDHLDYKTIVKIKERVGCFYVSLGVGSHLEAWGIENIVELDWWESVEIGKWRLTATPGRHFSGRNLKRNRTLWSSFVLEAEGWRLFLGGDSGYDEHFKVIGEKFGPFDLALLECGQFGKYWPHIHMFPKEVVQAARDLRAQVLMPVHWAKFSLSLHPWNEPIREMTMEAERVGQRVTTPMIGEVVVLGKHYPTGVWWNFE